MILAIWIEHPLPMPVQRSHDSDPREHRRATEIGDQDQGFHRRLPLRLRVDGFRELRDVIACIPQRMQRAAVGNGDRLVELALPAPVANWW